MIAYVLAAAVLLISMLLAWGVGFVGGLTGAALLILRALLIVLGIAGAVLLVIWQRRRAQAGGTTVDGTALDGLLREAEGKLAASQHTTARSLRNLPLLYVLGDADSAKTTAVIKSGLEPELLAGEVYREKDVVPTQLANIWYSEKTAIVEAGLAIRQSPALWSRLLLRTRPQTYRAAFGAGLPSRAAVVCVSCHQFLSGATLDSMQAAAAVTGEQLRQMSRLLGAAVPVYVLLTKLDRVPGFSDFVRNLSPEEASQLLGAVPQTGVGKGQGSYAEQAHAAVASAYDGLIFSLAEARLDLLSREADSTRLGGTYEFPRELRKFRDHLTTYLVELARPSQLSSNPYLRGFFLTGIRAQIRQAAAPAVSTSVRAAEFDPGATNVFSFQSAAVAAPWAVSAGVTEKIAQWTFLPRFFRQAVLGDTGALSGTSRSSHAALFRRVLFGTAAALLLLYLCMLTLSYFNNAALEQAIESASNSLAAAPPGMGSLATAQQLTLLDGLRTRVAALEDYRQNGAPLMYRWGLYRGDLLLGPARRLYFAHFRTLLLNRAQANILTDLNGLPATSSANPAPGAEYNGIYAALRAYLITTTHPDKSTAEFLSPVLERFWAAGVDPTAEQRQLATKQFDFYAGVLPQHNPYAIAPVESTVGHARSYLASFGGFERIYQSMLTAAEKAGPPIDFNRQHPRSAETVVEPHIVPAAFTKPGFAFMQDALAHPDRYFSGEAWVLGNQAPPSIETGNLREQLTTRYLTDYISQWRAFLKDATVVRYHDLRDAGAKLTVLSGNNSPLLALIGTVSQNTSVPNPEIANAFQAPQAFVPGASADVYIGPANKTYVDALLALNASINQVTQNPAGASDPAAAMPVSAAASAAHLAAQQSAQGFHVDAQGHVDATTLALMEAPITSTEGLVHGLGPAAANAGGKSFCSAFSTLFAKVPFNPASPLQANPAEVTALLQPGTGALWQFYNANLKALLVQQGAEYVVAPNPPMQVNPAFVHFFTRAANLSQSLFPAGASGPTLTFVLKNLPSNGIQSSLVKVDAQSLTNSDPQKQFTWAAQTAQSASLTANNLPLTFTGPWAVFLMFDKAHSARNGGAYELSFPLEVANTPVRAPDGTPVVARFELSGPGADVLAPGSLSGLHCVGNVAR